MASELVDNFNRLSLKNKNRSRPPRRKEFAPIKVKKDVSIVKQLLNRIPKPPGGWSPVDFSEVCTYYKVEPTTSIFEDLEYEFHDTGCRKQIQTIYRVQNPYLYVQYALKLRQKKELHGKKNISEGHLYHGTKYEYLFSICEKNFDWRLLGCNGMRSNKFGNGVSFSPSSLYASRFPRNWPEEPRVMIVAQVMEGFVCDGKSGMVIPPEPYDTSKKPDDGDVVVKYFDNEFYPKFIIYYS